MTHAPLLTLTERTWGNRPSTPHDFTLLSQSILRQTHQTISVSTLKRLWGYVPSDHEPRQDVLDILALFCGYTSYDAFCRASEEGTLPSESNLIMGECLKGVDVRPGRSLRVLWSPQSACTFCSLGQARFEVIASSGSKLPVGATFTCQQFIQGEPLYLTDLRLQPDSQPATYVCGRDEGVKIL